MGNPGTLNYYTYCAGDPINNTDPTGHSIKNLFNKTKKAVSKVVRVFKKAAGKQNTSQSKAAESKKCTKTATKKAKTAVKKAKKKHNKDGETMWGTWKGVRVGGKKTKAKIATVFPDNQYQPKPKTARRKKK